jgi:hypothetical protein
MSEGLALIFVYVVPLAIFWFALYWCIGLAIRHERRRNP